MGSIIFSEPRNPYAIWNYNLPSSALFPDYAASINPYLTSEYTPLLSFQQRSALGEPLPTDFAGMQQTALESLAMWRFQQTPKVNPIQTFQNFGGINQFGFVDQQYPRVEFF